MTRTVRARIVLPLALVAGCGGASAAAGGWPRVVQPRDVDAASGAPHVARVRDLGPPVPLPDGALARAQSDGAFTIGEYVLVEGEDFGKLPTVLVGGRPARVLARTAGGGIVTQIPAGVGAGKNGVEVSHPGGRHQLSIAVKRHAVVLDPTAGQVHFLEVGATDARAAAAAPLAAPYGVRFSGDGAWAYVASASVDPAGGTTVSTIAVAAPGGPAVVHTTRSAQKGPIRGFAVAGKRLAVVTGASFQLFALDEPETTAPYQPVALPPEIAAVNPVDADLSPDGERLAILTADNAVTTYSLATPEAPEALATVQLLPGKRLPLVRDLRFDGTGTLWVIAGDSRESLAVGHVTTQLIRIDAVAGSAPRAVDVAGAGPPLALAPAPRESLRSATTIGDTADDLPVFVTCLDQKLVAPRAGEATAALVTGLAEPGQVVRTDAAGRGGPLPALPGAAPGAIALSPDATLLLATAWRFGGAAPDAAGAAFGVWVSGVGADAAPVFVELARAGAPPAYLPASLGDVAVQP